MFTDVTSGSEASTTYNSPVKALSEEKPHGRYGTFAISKKLTWNTKSDFFALDDVLSEEDLVSPMLRYDPSNISSTVAGDSPIGISNFELDPNDILGSFNEIPQSHEEPNLPLSLALLSKYHLEDFDITYPF